MLLKEVGVVVGCQNSDYSLPKGKEVVFVDPNYFRPTEIEELVGDASKARDMLGWRPRYDLRSLIKEMINADLQIAIQELESSKSNSE